MKKHLLLIFMLASVSIYSQQKNPILASDDPFGSNFDTTIVYAPIFGRTFYAGLRFKIK